jgi:hypothetical protein
MTSLTRRWVDAMQSDQGFVHGALAPALGQGHGHGALMANVPCFIASPVFID